MYTEANMVDAKIMDGITSLFSNSINPAIRMVLKQLAERVFPARGFANQR
jgi:hypothetical protein